MLSEVDEVSLDPSIISCPEFTHQGRFCFCFSDKVCGERLGRREELQQQFQEELI